MEQFLSAYWLDITGTIIGLVYVWQEYRASIWLWATGIIMPLVYTVVYWQAGLYADFGLQIYYVLAAIYGFAVWRWGKNKAGQATETPITRFPRRLVLPAFLAFLALWGGIYWLLITLTNSNVPVLDSFGNALSIVGLWALSRKYLEQWWIWLVVDAEFSALYCYKDIPFTAGLYALYAVICVAGYRKWKENLKTEG